MRHQRQYRERPIFPISGRQLFPRWQTLQASFVEWESTSWKNIWLINWLLLFEVWGWHSAASQEKTTLESCNLRCNNDGYFVTMYMYVWHAWNQNLLTHLPECSALSPVSHLNRMRAHGLWNDHKWSTIALVNWWEGGWIEG